MDLQFTNKTVLVMGASRGLGRAIASELAQEGANLILVARNQAAISELAQDLESKNGVSVQVWPTDLGKAEDRDRLLERINALPRLDALLANSGGPKPGTAPGIAAQTWRDDFETMVVSLIAVMDQAVAKMQAQKSGRIVLISSSGIVQPIPQLAVSNSLRASLAAYAKTLADSVAKDGISVNLMLPGRVATERLEELDGAAAKSTGRSVEQVQESIIATIPMGRYGSPKEFAQTACFLLSDCASYCTGNLLRVDGGAIKGIW